MHTSLRRGRAPALAPLAACADGGQGPDTGAAASARDGIAAATHRAAAAWHREGGRWRVVHDRSR